MEEGGLDAPQLRGDRSRPIGLAVDGPLALRRLDRFAAGHPLRLLGRDDGGVELRPEAGRVQLHAGSTDAGRSTLRPGAGQGRQHGAGGGGEGGLGHQGVPAAQLLGISGDEVVEADQVLGVVDGLQDEAHEAFVVLDTCEEALGVGLVGVHRALVAEGLGIERGRRQQVLLPAAGLVLDDELEAWMRLGQVAQSLPKAGPSAAPALVDGRQGVECEGVVDRSEGVPERQEVGGGTGALAAPPLENQAGDEVGTVGEVPLQSDVAGVAGEDVAVELGATQRLAAAGEDHSEEQPKQNALSTSVLQEQHA